MNADLSITTKLTNDIPSNILPPKVFVQPFRLALKKGESDDVTWIEVRSLQGLRNIFEKIEKGTLTEIDRFSSVEMQLWGLMAEHSGFLRYQGSDSSFAAGIQPTGEQTAALADDLSIFTGGDEIAALEVLGSIQSTLRKRPFDNTPMTVEESAHEFVKPDGVNLTEKGEDVLQDLVYGEQDLPAHAGKKHSAEAVAFRKDSENAIQIFMETPAPTLEERAVEDEANKTCVDHGDKPLNEICKENAVPPTEEPKIVGSEAAKIGQLIAVAARGLDTEVDDVVREQSRAALDILHTMVEEGHRLDRPSFEEVLKNNDVSMDVWVQLAGIGQKAKRRPNDPNAQSKLDPAEARKNQESNLKKLVSEVSEVDLESLVDQSPSEQTLDDDPKSNDPGEDSPSS
jgi:hypothetical protein